MEKIALLLAGQGAQAVGMGKELFEQSAAARACFERADQVLGAKLTDVCFNGPEARLTDTSWCQPAILTHSLAALAAIQERYPSFQYQAAAGLSLGEISALTAVGCLGFEDGLRLVRRRGELMQQACAANAGGMAAVMGIDLEKLQAVCREAEVDVANLNAPGQIVISGSKAGIEKAVALAKAQGAKRAMPLTVAGAYHSRLMKPAADQLALFLQSITFQPGRAPVISNVTAQPHDPAKLKERLVEQVTSSVRWEDSVRYLLAQGFRRFVEVGPGEVLAGLVKRIDRQTQVASVGQPADLEKVAAMAVNS